MTNLDYYLFTALVIFFGYLSWSVCRAANAKIAPAATEDETPGKGFDAGSISPQIAQLRQNHISALRAHRAFPCGRIERIATARCAVSRLSFFQDRKSGVTVNENEPLTLVL